MAFKILQLLAAIIAFVLSTKSGKPRTRIITVLLAGSILLKFDKFIGLSFLAPYAFALFSLAAAAECFNSFNLKLRHKVFILIPSLFIVLYTAFIMIGVPVDGPIYIVSILYYIVGGYFYFFEKKKIKTRLGILLIWAVYFLSWFKPLIGPYLSQLKLI